MNYFGLKDALTQLKIGLTQAKIDLTPSENLLTQIFGQVLVCPCRKSAEKKPCKHRPVLIKLY